MNSKGYKCCLVPQCKNTSIKTPNKVFVHVPNKKIIRDKWLKLARRNPRDVVTSSAVYFCEDHFDLPNDMENYMQYHVMGSVPQVRMKPGCMPKKFICQPDRQTRTSDTSERPYIAKKRKMMIITECEKQFEEKSVVTNQPSTEEIASTSSADTVFNSKKPFEVFSPHFGSEITKKVTKETSDNKTKEEDYNKYLQTFHHQYAKKTTIPEFTAVMYSAIRDGNKSNKSKTMAIGPAVLEFFPKPCLEYRRKLIKISKQKHLKICPKCAKCDLWVKRCGRSDGRFQGIDNVNKDTYICSLHFEGESGPTTEYPNPISCTEKRNSDKGKVTRTSLAEKYKESKDTPNLFEIEVVPHFDPGAEGSTDLSNLDKIKQKAVMEDSDLPKSFNQQFAVRNFKSEDTLSLVDPACSSSEFNSDVIIKTECDEIEFEIEGRQYAEDLRSLLPEQRDIVRQLVANIMCRAKMNLLTFECFQQL